MLDFCIIGTGISGSTIAKLLNQKFSVNVYDKAKGIGGRSSFKRLNGKIGFDHGLQYLSPRSLKFRRFTKELTRKKILKLELNTKNSYLIIKIIKELIILK